MSDLNNYTPYRALPDVKKAMAIKAILSEARIGTAGTNSIEFPEINEDGEWGGYEDYLHKLVGDNLTGSQKHRLFDAMIERVTGK